MIYVKIFRWDFGRADTGLLLDCGIRRCPTDDFSVTLDIPVAAMRSLLDKMSLLFF